MAYEVDWVFDSVMQRMLQRCRLRPTARTAHAWYRGASRLQGGLKLPSVCCGFPARAGEAADAAVQVSVCTRAASAAGGGEAGPHAVASGRQPRRVASGIARSKGQAHAWQPSPPPLPIPVQVIECQLILAGSTCCIVSAFARQDLHCSIAAVAL